MSLEVPEIELPEPEDLDTPFKRRVAILVAAITFFASVVALLRNQVSTKEDIAAREAQLLAVKGLGTQVKTSDEAGYEHGVYVEAQRYDRRRVLAAKLARFREGSAEGQRARTEAARWERVKTSLTPLSPLLQRSALTETDPAFADRYRNQANRDVYVVALQQSRELRLARAWGTKSDSYLWVITVLASALFLLGLSLTVRSGIRRVLFAAGVVLAVGCLLVTAPITFWGRPTRVPDDALELVADADVLASQHEYERAIERYDQAIMRRGDYIEALGRRAEARLFHGSHRGSPSSLRGFVRTTDPVLLRKALDDGERAVRLGARGVDDVGVITNLGRSYFLAAAVAARPPDGEDGHRRSGAVFSVADREGLYEAAARFARRATELNPDLPTPWLTLAVVEAARSDPDAVLEPGSRARQAYEEGLERVDRRPDAAEREALYSGAFGDLELVAQSHRRELRRMAVVTDLKELLVERETMRETGRRVGRARPPGVELHPFAFAKRPASADRPSKLNALFHYEGMQRGMSVAFIWYVRPTAAEPWSQAPELSYIGPWPLEPPAGPAESPGSPGSCPPSGQYRLEVYVEGEFVRSGETEIDPGALGRLLPHEDEVRGFSVCRPEGWGQPSLTEDAVTFASPSRALTFVVRTFVDPRAVSRKAAAEIEAITELSGGHAAQGGFDDFLVGGQPGKLRYFVSMGTGRGMYRAIAASVGTDGVVRTVEAAAPLAVSDLTEQLLVLNELLATLRFTDAPPVLGSEALPSVLTGIGR